jgi:hypothetical protein
VSKDGEARGRCVRNLQAGQTTRRDETINRTSIGVGDIIAQAPSRVGDRTRNRVMAKANSGINRADGTIDGIEDSVSEARQIDRTRTRRRCGGINITSGKISPERSMNSLRRSTKGSIQDKRFITTNSNDGAIDITRESCSSGEAGG